MINKTRVYVLGASGFVGRYLVRFLPGNFDVTILTRNSNSSFIDNDHIQQRYCDLLVPDSVVGVLKDCDVLINLVYNRNCSPADNILMMKVLTEECKRSEIKRVIHVSTALIIGSNKSVLLDEKVSCDPVGDYGGAKNAIEKLFLALSETIEIVILRPTVIFGIGGINLKDFIKTLIQENKLKGTLRASIVGNTPMNLVPVETVASVIRFFVDCTPRSTGIYFVSQDDDVSNNLAAVDEIVSRKLNIRRLFRAKLPRGFIRTSLLQLLNIELDKRPMYSSAKLSAVGFTDFHDLSKSILDYCSDAMFTLKSDAI
jgi:nucleoside-diphosphate-sugar epimerase